MDMERLTHENEYGQWEASAEGVTPSDRADLLQKAITTYGTNMQTDMCIEEMSELTKALLKYRRLDVVARAGAEGEAANANIREEMADVQVMLDQMRLIYGGTKEQEAYKLERLKSRLESLLE